MTILVDVVDRVLVLVLEHDLLVVVSHKQESAHHHVVQQTAQTEHVRLLVEREAFQDVGVNVAGRTALHQQLLAVRRTTCQTQICYAHLHLYLIENKDIVRFDIPMEDA